MSLASEAKQDTQPWITLTLMGKAVDRSPSTIHRWRRESPLLYQAVYDYTLKHYGASPHEGRRRPWGSSVERHPVTIGRDRENS